jgi:hypothetical protein
MIYLWQAKFEYLSLSYLYFSSIQFETLAKFKGIRIMTNIFFKALYILTLSISLFLGSIHSVSIYYLFNII